MSITVLCFDNPFWEKSKKIDVSFMYVNLTDKAFTDNTHRNEKFLENTSLILETLCSKL